MRFFSRLAGAVLAICAAVHVHAIEPGASYGSFEGRDYLLVWPKEPPTRVVLYLHASGPKPFAYEARAGMLEALAADANRRGYALIAPAASKGSCAGAGASPTADIACWRVDAVRTEIESLDRLVDFVGRNAGVSFASRDAIGYEMGSELLLAAFARRDLDHYGRVGLLDPTPPPASMTLEGASPSGPLVYIEAATGDPVGQARASDLLKALVAAEYGKRVCTRSGDGDRLYSGPRLASFLAWFDVDCRDLTPRQPPPGDPAGSLVIDGGDVPDAPAENVSEDSPRRRPRL